MRVLSSLLVSTVLLAAVLLAAGSARAQASPRSAPVGGRSALMGGTGVALARDGAAPFLNPATIIHIDDSGLAFSVNFYTAQWAHLSGFHQPGGGAGPSLPDTSLDATRADALPSTLCLFLTIGDWGDNRAKAAEPEVPGRRKGRRKLAACLAQPERSQFSATAVGYTGQAGSLGASQATSIQRSWNRLYVGPSYSVYVSDRVALGAALNGIGTTASSTWGVDTLFAQSTQAAAAGSASTYDTGMTAYSVDLNAVLGLVWHIDDVQVLGASVSTPSVHVLGNYSGTAAVQSQGPGGQGATLATSSGNFNAPVPVRVAAGFGVETRGLRIEGDASAYLPVTYLARTEVQTQLTSLAHGATASASFPSATQMAGWPVVDVGLGLEYFLSRRFSLLTGASTDMSELAPLPARPAVGTLAETRMQRVTTSIGVGSYGDGSELLLGTELSYAWGKSIALDPYGAAPQLALVDQRTYQVMLIIAGSASISAFRRTLQDLGEVVKFPQSR